MRFGFGGHIEGMEPIDPQTMPKDGGAASVVKNAAE
jgi:hypothetical protein